MPFVKVTKNKPYFKRFQVKYRRRREGKTDYQRRKAMCSQDKNKYNASKYRFVVRFTNKDIICQVVRSKIVGDEVLTAAYAHELPLYGLKVGLTNYAAAYCVGLLAARRLLKKYKLDTIYPGQDKVNGEDYYVSAVDDGPNPFFCILDIGLARMTTGSKVFAAMKGATDGGVEIPHKTTRFIGYDTAKGELKADTLKNYIFGGHVGNYMNSLKKDDEEKYKKHFSIYLKNGLTAEALPALYAKVHKAIRADPEHKKKTTTAADKVDKKKRFSQAARSIEQRKARVAQKKAHHKKTAAK